MKAGMLNGDLNGGDVMDTANEKATLGIRTRSDFGRGHEHGSVLHRLAGGRVCNMAMHGHR